MTKILAEVKGLGVIVEECSDFYTELVNLKKAQAHLVTPRNEAYARIKTAGKEAIGRSNGTYTTVGVEYARKQPPLLIQNSRLLDKNLAKQAVEANRNGKYFHLDTTKEYEKSLEQAEKDKSKAPSKRRAIILPSRGSFVVTPSENQKVLEFLLKDQAKKYFELNGSKSITFYPVDKNTVDAQDGTLLTQMWFGSLDSRSVLDGLIWNLSYYLNRARGVQKSGVATQKKSSKETKPYTSRQLNKNLNILKKIRQGRVKISDLEAEVEKVAEFLESLKQ